MRRPCCEKEGTNKGAWSKQEDQKLIEYIRVHGEGCWRSIPKAAGLYRCGKSCRLRWINYLRPDIKRGNFSEDEEELIVKLHALLGNRWSLIAGRLPGRTDNEVKNYWNSHIRRKLIKMGIDPNNHKLHQGFPLAQASAAASEEPSSGSINEQQTVLPPLIKPSGAVGDDRVSDTQSCPNFEETAVTPMVAAASSSSSQLNLDLTIAFPLSSPARLGNLMEDEPKPTFGVSNARNVDNESTPTLLLFQ